MFKPLSLYIGCRYTRAKKRNHFISFISAISIIGIALGVAVLITVLSVMNGFDQQIRKRMLIMMPQVTITEWNNQLTNWQELTNKLQGKFDITGMAPFVNAETMLSANNTPAFVLLKGIDPKAEQQVSPIGKKLISGNLNSLKAGKFNIILGNTLAKNLGVGVGDKVTAIVPQTNITPFGTMPRLKQFTVTGTFKVGYQFDNSYALINIHDAQTLVRLGNKVSGLQLKLSNLFLAPETMAKIRNELPSNFYLYDWTEQNPNFFKALQMEKTMMFLILVLIIAVAAFNMLSSLVMLVTDKQADIAILRTLGIQTKTLISTFVIQGAITGLAGTILGVIGGVLLSLNVTALSNAVQSAFNVHFINANVYFLNYLPSALEVSDVIEVALVAFALSLLATIYPAWRASKIVPVDALRYE